MMVGGSVSPDKQVKQIIAFADVCKMYQDKIDKISKRIQTISEAIDMASKELEFKNYKSVQYRLNYIKVIIGETNDTI